MCRVHCCVFVVRVLLKSSCCPDVMRHYNAEQVPSASIYVIKLPERSQLNTDSLVHHRWGDSEVMHVACRLIRLCMHLTAADLLRSTAF